jgi:hypothetical protein
MRAVALISSAALLIACARESGSELDSRPRGAGAASVPAAAAESPEEQASVASYPPSRWRLASLNELHLTLLRLSHILIRHEGVQEGVVSFQLADWTPSPPPPTRTPEQARARAEQIAARLQRNPSEFAAVARELSEDVATQPIGGMLGIRSATDYIRTPEVLDAVAALRPGEVSRVVETQYGFHVLQRMPPLEEQTVRAARILIAHDKAPWLGMFLARGQVPKRSPEEAQRLAQSLYERAQQGEPFETLARQYSEHREAVRGGDFGTWSTREPTPFPLELEVLARLQIGEISPPMDTPFGIAVMQRLPSKARAAFGMAILQQLFDPRAPESDPTSRKWVAKNVRALAQEVGKNPAKFAQLQKQYCCEREEHWIEGRGEAEAEAMLRRLALGEVAAEPVELPRALAIIKRLEPRPASAPKYILELPAPEKPDLRNLVSIGMMPTMLSGFKAESASLLGLDAARATELTTLIDTLLHAEDPEEADRLARFDWLQSQVQALLGPGQFPRYLELLNTYVERTLLQPKSSPRGRMLSGLPAPVQ